MSYQHALIQSIFSANSALHPLSGVQVYHNNFIENGIRALSISFPTLHYLVDEPDFRAIAKAYLLDVPKTQFDWADYGAEFADFILHEPKLRELPYLSEVAELDYLVAQSDRFGDIEFDAESFGLLNSGELENLQFVMAPGFQIAHFIFPVEYFYQLASNPNLHPQSPERTLFMQNLNKLMSDAINSDQARSIVLWRPDFKTQMLSLSDSELAIFKQLARADSIANIFAGFANAPQTLEPWLSEQISQKRIFGVRKNQ
jgi:hypothetical protein